MGGVFSKKSKTPPLPAVSEQDQAILQLKTQRDKMKQFIKRKEKCMERERQLAKQLIVDGRKDRALLLLKKKRLQENVIDQTLKQLDTIEKMVTDLEFADIQQRVVEGLKQGNEALKKMNSLFDIDEIEKIMEETREGAEYQEEISSLISGQLSSSDVESCEEELAALLAAEKGEAEEIRLPEAPTGEIQGPSRGTEKPVAEKERRKEKVSMMA
ncbi:vps-20 [Pristionchus pacificus]|nr:vps-20 [Pristionchus pacificus]